MVTVVVMYMDVHDARLELANELIEVGHGICMTDVECHIQVEAEPLQ